MRQADDSVVGAYVVRTSSLNDKHRCQLFRMGITDKITPTITTPLIRANMSCAVATIFSSLAFLTSSISMVQSEQLCSCISFSSLAHLSFLSPYVSLQLIVVTSLHSFESGQVLFLVVFCFLIFASYPQPFFPLSSVSEALLVLIYPIFK